MESSLVDFSNGIITIMDSWGFVEDPNTWIIDCIQIDVPNPPISEEITNLILSDQKAGRGHLIDHVLISNRYALLLSLEGFLSKNALENSEEVEGGDLVVYLTLAGKQRKVVIRNENNCNYHLATIDADGNVV